MFRQIKVVACEGKNAKTTASANSALKAGSTVVGPEQPRSAALPVEEERPGAYFPDDDDDGQ